MKYESLLKNAKTFAARYNVHLNGLRIPGDSNSHVSVGLTHMSLEYYESVIFLMGRGAYRASGALIRPQYEALVRALYYFRCASTVKAEDFMRGKKVPTIYEMISQIEKHPGLDAGYLSRFHSRNSKTMHDLTHGGIQQYLRSFTGNELIPNFTDQDKYDLLKSAALLGVTAASHVAAIAGSIELARMIQKDFKELCTGGT
jgi:hypothetical protein